MNERRLTEPTGPIRRVAGAVADVLFPAPCLACASPLERSAARFCEACLRTIEAERGKLACPRCAGNVAIYEVRDGCCGECRGRVLHVSGVARVAPYGGVVAGLLREFKYNQRESAGRAVGDWLSAAVAEAPWRCRLEAVTFVPSHWSHRLLRPPHPAESLARRVARRLGLACVPLLRRVRTGRHQVGLTYQQRLINPRGMFAVRDEIELRNAIVLLIDDVRTTGATLNECARRMRRAGAGDVFGAVAVRAQPGLRLRQHIDDV